MIGITRMALSPDKTLRGHYHGTSACLSALLRAGRYEEIESVLAHTDFWHYKCYAVKALAAQLRHDDAIALADSLRGDNKAHRVPRQYSEPSQVGFSPGHAGPSLNPFPVGSRRISECLFWSA
jgi:hypothetical protein